MRLVERDESGAIIHVTTQDAVPTALTWQGRRYRVVKVEATWCVEGRWWLDPQRTGLKRRYYRLAVTCASRSPLCIEIYQCRSIWKMAGLAD